MHPVYTKEYRQTLANDFVVVANDTLTIPSFLRDRDKWEDFDEDKLEEYFSNSYEIFMDRLKEFRNGEKKITKEEEKELKFMLETLINTKNMLEETKKLSNRNR